MARKKKIYFDHKKAKAELFTRTEGYAAKVRTAYRASIKEIINLVKGTELVNGVPFSFSDYGYESAVTPILRSMYSQVYQIVSKGAKTEWLKSNENNDELIKAVFGEHSIENNFFARYFERNMAACDAFIARKSGPLGLDLSQRVWNYTNQHRKELEGAIGLAIGEGTPANALATKIQKYLNDPDRFYRRFRVKVGEDENGNPVYGRVWKRRIYDNESGSYKWINDNPKDYHPGRGVYRSSYRNAQRLARTETNIAYRTADYDRWDRLDFVVGIEIKLSNNHPVVDICDDLKGVYPKTFKWTGWHPNCRCYMTPVLASQEELDKMIDKILDGDNPADVNCAGTIKDMPTAFVNWAKDNAERMAKAEGAGTLPYFIKDNKGIVDNILNGPTPEQKAAMALGDVLANPLDWLGKFSLLELQNVHKAVSDKLALFQTGDLESQVSSLKFEYDWVIDKKKYATWEVAADAYKKALDAAQAKLNAQKALGALADDVAAGERFLSIHTDASELKTLLDDIANAVAKGDATTLTNASDKIHDAIHNYKAQRAKTGSVSQIEKYCDANRTFDAQVYDQATFAPYQDARTKDCITPWTNGSDEAKRAITDYTDSSYGSVNSSYWKNFKPHSDGTLIDSILDDCSFSEDLTLRRGCSKAEMSSIFGKRFGELVEKGDIDALNKLVGYTGVNEGFISTTFDMNGGFSGNVDLRIYAPKGTQGIYAKGISVCQDGKGANWVGISNSQFRVGAENEIIIHRGYEYRFIKAEQDGGRIKIFIELLTRKNRVVK